MGLGLLIGGLIFGGAGIAVAIDNAKMKKDPVRHLDDGTPVYIDRKCHEWINGEKVIATYDYENQKLVYAGQKSGKVYYDPEQKQAERMRKTYDEPNLKQAKERGDLTCKLWYPQYKMMLSTELATNRIIIRISKNYKTNQYKKYYYTGNYQPCISNGCFKFPDDGNMGVEISKEEYDKLNEAWDVSYTKGLD